MPVSISSQSCLKTRSERKPIIVELSLGQSILVCCNERLQYWLANKSQKDQGFSIPCTILTVVMVVVVMVREPLNQLSVPLPPTILPGLRADRIRSESAPKYPLNGHSTGDNV